jgi:hypothetical protein
MVEELANAITKSAGRLGEALGRVQRFANLDRGAVRPVDVNQLIRDTAALMNPPKVGENSVALHLDPLPVILCRPHGLSVALAFILGKMLEQTLPVRIESCQEGGEHIIRIVQLSATAPSGSGAELMFSDVDRQIRASGWDLFAARQMVHHNGGNQRLETGHPGSLLCPDSR